MHNSQEIFDLIERYLSDELSQEERLDFEEQISLDQELADEVEAHKLANKVILDYNLLKSKNNFAKWQKQNNSRPGLSALAGLIVLGLIICSVLILDNSDEDNAAMTKQKEQNFKADYFVDASELQVEQKDILAQNSSNELVEPKVPKKEEVSIEILKIERKNLKVDAPSVENTIANSIKLKKIDRVICSDTLSVSSIQYKGSCGDETNGFITLSNKTPEGKILINFSIDKGRTFQNHNSFQFLKNGTYWPVMISDDGCFFVLKKPIVLSGDSSCVDVRTYVIDRSQNQFWQPESEIENANIQIRNSSGVVVYSSKLSDNFRWYGYGSDGQRLTMGEYLYIISAGNDKSVGSITIVR